MLDQRRRRWAVVVKMLYKCLVFINFAQIIEMKWGFHIDHGLKVENLPPPLGIFVDHIFFLTSLCTKLLSGGLQIFYAWTRSPEVIEVWDPLPLGLYKNVSYN